MAQSDLAGCLARFRLIWDEDHDERVIQVIEELHFAGLMGSVRFIGERKGSLSVLIDPETVDAWAPAALESYREAVSHISQAMDDPWPATVDTVPGSDHPIIQEPPKDVGVYLKNIHLLWQLGRKPYQRAPTPN